jgi:hypothetical protein
MNKRLIFFLLITFLIFSIFTNAFATINYKQMGKVYPQGAFTYDGWVKAYETTLGTAATSLTISGLTGDTAKEYKLETRIVNGYNGTANYSCRLNADGATNYGDQQFYNSDATTVAAVRSTATSHILLGNNGALSSLNQSTTIIQAKSGYVRTAITEWTGGISNTTVTHTRMVGTSWNNTADEITSLVILADQTDGLGVGSYICLWKRVYKQ